MTDSLLSLAALEVACDEGLTPHLARLDEAIAGSADPTRFVLERVREALAIHLALLQQRPDALWPVLYAHAAFVDSPRARTFGVSAPGPDMPMFEQVGRWLAERKRLHPDTPWLRALTPTTRWGGALLAELRTVERPKLVSMTDDELLLAAGDQLVRWRPATGALSNEVGSPEGAAPRQVADFWRNEPNPAPQRAVLVRPPRGGLGIQHGDHLEWLVQPGWGIVSLSETTDRVACIATDGDEAIAFVFTLATGQQVASFEATPGALALSSDGAWLAWGASDELLSVRHLASGRQASVRLAGSASSLAVSVTGTHVGVVEDGVVRQYRARTAPSPRPFTRRPLAPTFSRDGSALLLGQFVLDGVDGSVRLTHRHTVQEYLEGGPARFGVRLTAQRLCVCEGMTTETVALATGRVTRFSGVEAAQRHRVAWSGDGLVLAVCRHGHNSVSLHSPTGVRTAQASGPLEAIALDQTGSQLALLHVDGTVELQAGGTRLRSCPGATGLAFLANDRALGVGGRTSTVVLGLDGRERWNAPTRFLPTDEVAAGVEWRSGMRAPSIAESLLLSTEGGLLVAAHEAQRAVFPSRSTAWVRSPSANLLASGTTLLSWEAL